jgi:V-type H+-transporting ATPase subunit a
MSIVMGVIQMTLGILLSVFNHFQFKNRMSIYLEFIPQLVFLQSIFGYLCFLILYKWTVDWNATDVNGHPLHSSPPGLLNTLIFMFLQPGTVNPKDQLYAGQGPVQYALVMVALICVPIMLFGKPLYERYEWMQKKRAGYAPLQGSTQPEEDGDHRPNPAEQMEQEHEFDFSDAMVHQVIHTIEFCLGCISHTASYLRLWALSLAHSQLSIVLWDMTIRACYTSLPPHLMPFGLVVGFYMWFSLTLFILLLMEGLSAFLHAVRLHWVEFNSKFYNGTGHKFDPFSLRTITLGEEDVE